MNYFSSAFKPLSPEPANKQMEQQIYSNKHYGPMNAQLPTTKFTNEVFYTGDVWQRSQIQQLFKLYNQYGSQWKILAQKIPSRTANNLKNRFYTVLRNLVKLLFRKKADCCPKLPGEIPSKDLCRLYDGKQEYQSFKFIISTILQRLNYDLQSLNINNIVTSFSEEIVKIYLAIYRERAIVALEEQKERKTGQQNQFSSILGNSQNKNLKQIENNIVYQKVQGEELSNYNVYPAKEPIILYFYVVDPTNFYTTAQM